MKKMHALLKTMGFAYPLLIWFLRDKAYFLAWALPFTALLFLEFFWRAEWPLRIFGASLVAILCFALHDTNSLLRLYPFLMSLSVLHLFWQSKDPAKNPMMGPLRDKIHADPRLMAALHESKRIWIVGLSINTAILGILIFFFSMETWALYANLYSYLLLALLFALTFLYVAWRRKHPGIPFEGES